MQFLQFHGNSPSSVSRSYSRPVSWKSPEILLIQSIHHAPWHWSQIKPSSDLWLHREQTDSSTSAISYCWSRTNSHTISKLPSHQTHRNSEESNHPLLPICRHNGGKHHADKKTAQKSLLENVLIASCKNSAITVKEQWRTMKEQMSKNGKRGSIYRQSSGILKMCTDVALLRKRRCIWEKMVKRESVSWFNDNTLYNKEKYKYTQARNTIMKLTLLLANHLSCKCLHDSRHRIPTTVFRIGFRIWRASPHLHTNWS